MDELLHERVEQLKLIDGRLHDMLRNGIDDPFKAVKDLRAIRTELADMIRRAEEAYAAF